MLQKIILLISLLVVGFHNTWASNAGPRSFGLQQQEETLIFADEIFSDQALGLVIARGNVQITYGKNVLYANVVTYNQKTDKATATGKVRIHRETGEVLFAEYSEITGDFKNAFAKKIRTILTDEALLAATTARRIDGVRTEFNYAVYTPCKVCSKKSPLWQIKSRHSVLDEAESRMTHVDASLEMFGVPLLYMPYFWHPTKRQSGFLIPSIIPGSDLGFVATIPYYWAIAEDKDMIIAPSVISENRFLLALEYRQAFKKGQFYFNSSLTSGDVVLKDNESSEERDKNRIRGHLFTWGKVNLNKNWRAGFNVQAVGDQTYLRRYALFVPSELKNKTMLVSNAYAENFFWQRSYSKVEFISFKGLRAEDKQSQTPLILPKVDIHITSLPDRFGGFCFFDGNALSLTRSKGTDMNRVSLAAGWERPILSQELGKGSFGFMLRQDAYLTNDHISDQSTDVDSNGVFTRFFPQLFFKWGMPWVKYSQSGRFIIEPVASIILAPRSVNTVNIPNEDSTIVELNEMNLLHRSRFPGLDRVDSGSRINYGLNLYFFSKYFGNTNVFVGQSYAFQNPGMRLQGTDFERALSDIVASFRMSITRYIAVNGAVLMDRELFRVKRNEINLTVGPSILQVSTTYSRLPRITNRFLATEQLAVGVNSNFAKYWSGNLAMTRALGSQGGALSHSASLTYKDECFRFTGAVIRSFYFDRDLRPDLSVMFTIGFKNLGERSFSTSANSSYNNNQPNGQ